MLTLVPKINTQQIEFNVEFECQNHHLSIVFIELPHKFECRCIVQKIL
jgi:hypothetical protein